MYKNIFNKLNNQKEFIYEEIESCKQNIEELGNLSISITNFNKLLSKTEDTIYSSNKFDTLNEEEKKIVNQNVVEFRKQLEQFSNTLSELENIRALNKIAMEEEIIKSKLSPNRPAYGENLNETVIVQDQEDREFFSSSTQRINNYILSAIDSFDSLKKQRAYLDNTRNKIKSGLVNLGLSSEVVDSISDRYLNDYYFFLVGVAIVVTVFILFKFVL